MVVDMKLSTDCMSEFQEHLQTVGMSLPISFSTLVLQSAAWPFHCLSSTFAVPNELLSSIKRVSGRDGGGEGNGGEESRGEGRGGEGRGGEGRGGEGRGGEGRGGKGRGGKGREGKGINDVISVM